MVKNYLGRVLLFLGMTILVALFSYEALSDEVSIINVHRNIPLSDSEPVFKDFYLNGGPESGIKKGMTITVVRKVGIKDATGTQTYGDLIIPVGQLRVIAVFNKLAVARELKLISRENEPMLDQVGIMVGDRVEFSYK